MFQFDQFGVSIGSEITNSCIFLDDFLHQNRTDHVLREVCPATRKQGVLNGKSVYPVAVGMGWMIRKISLQAL